MKKLLASVLARLGAAKAAQPQQTLQYIDPNSILFTTPTISDDLAPLEALARKPTETDFQFHEDEWSQVELLPQEQLSEVQRMLTEYKSFEREHRTQYGWRKVYVRKIQRLPVVSGPQPIQQLERLLGVQAGPAPLLYSSGAGAGSVKDGFSLPLGGGVTLYGYLADQAVPVLGALVDTNPDDLKLTQAFMKLNAAQGLVLVDWRSQFVLVSVDPTGQVDVWRP
jgi:hypothetical protein